MTEHSYTLGYNIIIMVRQSSNREIRSQTERYEVWQRVTHTGPVICCRPFFCTCPESAGMNEITPNKRLTNLRGHFQEPQGMQYSHLGGFVSAVNKVRFCSYDMLQTIFQSTKFPSSGSKPKSSGNFRTRKFGRLKNGLQHIGLYHTGTGITGPVPSWHKSTLYITVTCQAIRKVFILWPRLVRDKV